MCCTWFHVTCIATYCMCRFTTLLHVSWYASDSSVLPCVAVSWVCCSVMQYVAAWCNVLYVSCHDFIAHGMLHIWLECVAVCCSVLQCAAVCCSVLQCLECVAACCSVLQCVVVCRFTTSLHTSDLSLLQCIAVCWVCCSVLQCVAVCCSVSLYDFIARVMLHI